MNTIIRELYFRRIVWLIVISLGVIQCWAYCNEPETCLISYLETGEAYVNQSNAVPLSGFWSPFYSILLALAYKILSPSGSWFRICGLFVNLAIYIFFL